MLLVLDNPTEFLIIKGLPHHLSVKEELILLCLQKKNQYFWWMRINSFRTISKIKKKKKKGKESKSHRQGLYDDAAVAATSKDSCVQVTHSLKHWWLPKNKRIGFVSMSRAKIPYLIRFNYQSSIFNTTKLGGISITAQTEFGSSMHRSKKLRLLSFLKSCFHIYTS